MHWRCLIWTFLGENFKKTMTMFEINSQEFFSIKFFLQNNTNLNYKGLIGVSLSWNLDKTIVIVKVSHIEFFKITIFAKQKNFDRWTKTALFEYFYIKIWKKLLSYLKSAPSIILKCKVSVKSKKLQILYQIWINWVFLSCNFESILPYLKSAPTRLSNARFPAEIKILQLATKNAFCEYFWMLF